MSLCIASSSFNAALVLSSCAVGLFAKVGAGAVAELARQSVGPSQGQDTPHSRVGLCAVQSLTVVLAVRSGPHQIACGVGASLMIVQ